MHSDSILWACRFTNSNRAEITVIDMAVGTVILDGLCFYPDTYFYGGRYILHD
ncbi:hypothetical protein [Snodgrassella gandavensis]|uniref:hypothetical protein n=1 Tax=Snodgrassella gandavensis TaxID=2946698 RepID=UPI001EF55EA1|nr:hypothetical protein [Snodgrassella gandavensis]